MAVWPPTGTVASLVGGAGNQRWDSVAMMADGRVLYVYAIGSATNGGTGIRQSIYPNSTDFALANNGVATVPEDVTYTDLGYADPWDSVKPAVWSHPTTGDMFLFVDSWTDTIQRSVKIFTSVLGDGSDWAFYADVSTTVDPGIGASFFGHMSNGGVPLVSPAGRWILPTSRNATLDDQHVGVATSDDYGLTWTMQFAVGWYTLGGRYTFGASRFLVREPSGRIWWAGNGNVDPGKHGYSDDNGSTWTVSDVDGLTNSQLAQVVDTDGAQVVRYLNNASGTSEFQTSADPLDPLGDWTSVWSQLLGNANAIWVSTLDFYQVFVWGGQIFVWVIPDAGQEIGPLRIPWPRWAIDSGAAAERPSAGEQEHQNYVEIQRWWDRTRRRERSRLRVPFPRWAVETKLATGEQEHQNYLALERWADQWNTSPSNVPPLFFPYRFWANELPNVDHKWHRREQENYTAIERAVSATRILLAPNLNEPELIRGLNPTLWLDASDADTITESGGAVSEWRDKSVNTNHATQGTAGAQPTTGSVTLNGLNGISFDSGDTMASAAESDSQRRTTFAVVNRPSTASTGYIWYGGFGGYQLLHGNVGDRTPQAVKAGFAIIRTGPALPAVPHLLTNEWAGNSYGDYVNWYINGGTFTTATANLRDMEVGTNPLTIGYAVEIYELIIFDHAAAQMPTADREAVEAYLMDKWGL